ncbi:hypothetical protein N0V83_003078 [Neocucurbitaria cava]|uniref:Apple domain-containing protein n=1 Tax=Neocucurbitaria cava TaxID=798079 RepID=A0A9W8YG58_9PLEO|nr:hypothetical protein N0V83_003078 [Neocucurbitaria cava]
MRLSLVFAAALAASAEAAVLEKRQRPGRPGHGELSQRMWLGRVRRTHLRGPALLQQHLEVRNRHRDRHQRDNDDDHGDKESHNDRVSLGNPHSFSPANIDANADAYSNPKAVVFPGTRAIFLPIALPGSTFLVDCNQSSAGLCKADAKCKSFGYGEANCMLFDVPAGDNTNYNPMSPYTFYDVSCPVELPVRKRQLGITLGGPGVINISLGLGSPNDISSACSCYITKGPAETTVTKTATSAVVKTSTVVSTVTRTAGKP